VRRDWAGQLEIGRHDTVFRYSVSSGSWQIILISFCGVIGSPEPWPEPIDRYKKGTRSQHCNCSMRS